MNSKATGTTAQQLAWPPMSDTFQARCRTSGIAGQMEVPDKWRCRTSGGVGQVKVPDNWRCRTNGGAGQMEVLGPAGCGLSVGLKYSPRKNTTVSEPQQKEGHNLKSDRSAINAK